MEKIYLKTLDRISELMESVPNTPMGAYLKVIHLMTMNMRYEKIALNRNLPDHPYTLTDGIIAEQMIACKTMQDVLFI